MARLRDPVGGCPWDREQTYRSIAPHTIEEAYEVAETIEQDDLESLPGELGDLLFQVVFYARIAEEERRFDFGDVVAAICAKLIRRHPHVFGDEDSANADEQSARWEAIKRAERAERGEHRGLLADVTAGLPALSLAAKLGRRAASVGFDWETAAPVRDCVAGELAEYDEARAAGEPARIEAELGDVLFAAVNLCRHNAVDPEQALRNACRRFRARFGRVEARVEASDRPWSSFDAAELDALWRAAKADAQRAD